MNRRDAAEKSSKQKQSLHKREHNDKIKAHKFAIANRIRYNVVIRSFFMLRVTIQVIFLSILRIVENSNPANS
jgi:hypothetical protein